ncbi:hypothetical protein L6452_35694 [Arctium lappa]|uniref:Uncharacterized protein n=1 Tax=Arctium lappa TaxID=4217 RepID=A0ACB8Y6I6_ARCLA|nr:hypothetical protein L6452_35694 [Arctium lappa]
MSESESDSSSSSSSSTSEKFVQWLVDDSSSQLVTQYVALQKQQIVDANSSSIRKKKKRRNIDRNREDGDRRLYEDYFSENLTYNDDIFRHRFRMQRPLFLRIVEGVKNHDRFFESGTDCTRRSKLSPLQKCTAAIRMLAYGVAADVVDEYLRIGETITIKCVKKFARAIIAVFGDEYLRRPNVADLQRLLHIGHQRGFPGTLNDINVLDRSPIFHDVLERKAPETVIAKADVAQLKVKMNCWDVDGLKTI